MAAHIASSDHFDNLIAKGGGDSLSSWLWFGVRVFSGA